MTAITSGLHFLSGIAIHLGSMPARDNYAARPHKSERRRQARGDSRHTPLSERQKKELLESIKHDDWFE